MNELQGIWTQYGRERVAAWIIDGQRLNITHAAVGTGAGVVPDVYDTQTSLVEEVWRGKVNCVQVNPEDQTEIIVELVIPNDVGGFYVREWGAFDESGGLVAVGPHAEMRKPAIDSGQAAEFLERFRLPISNTNAVTLTIATEALATQAYVACKIAAHDADPAAHGMIAAQFAANIIRLSDRVTRNNLASIRQE